MNDSPNDVITCPNPACRVAETGKCVEGFEINECPHQKAGAAHPASPVPGANDEPVAESNASDVQVFSGDILTIDEATDILRCEPTRVLAIIGPVKSGKTTLGISLYDSFQFGHFDRWKFAGSLTLRAFEERCHPARSACGKTKPDTPRTSRSEGLGFLHLALHSQDMGLLNLLISDRSGEFYTAVADSLEDCEDLHEVSRADFVLILVDGEKLASEERHGIKSDVFIMVESLVQGGALGETHRVGIALTKYDLVLSSAALEQAEKDFDSLLEKLNERFSSTLAEIKAFKIAARPENERVEPRFGVLGILDECMRPRQRIAFESSRRLRLDRWFLRLNIGGNAR